jgi:hypothetical protein
VTIGYVVQELEHKETYTYTQHADFILYFEAYKMRVRMEKIKEMKEVNNVKERKRIMRIANEEPNKNKENNRLESKLKK